MNSEALARRWTEFVAGHPMCPFGERLLETMSAGRIARLCDCGCHGFDVSVDKDAVPPLVGPSEHGGAVLELSFMEESSRFTVEFVVFADERGFFSGMDVTCNGNGIPMAENIRIKEPPFHVHTFRR